MKHKEAPMPIPKDFPALRARALTGDQAAYTALYEATAQEVYRSIHAMIRDEELTLDVQQEVYAQAFTHLEQLEDAEKLLPWLRSIAVNCARYALRRQTPLLFSELEEGEGPALPELADESPEASPELRLEQKETARYLREILDGLTPGQRMLVGLYYYEQRPVGQIARELGVTPGTVKTQLFRSRKKIEAAVKRLEARGVNLYGLSPLPFLLALLKQQSPAPELGPAALGSSGTATAIRLGRRYFETLGGKLLLGLLSVSVIGGGILAFGRGKDRLLMGDVRPTEPIRISYSTEPSDDSREEPFSVSTEDPEPNTTAPTPVPESEEAMTEPEPVISAQPAPVPGARSAEPSEAGRTDPAPVVTEAPEPAVSSTPTEAPVESSGSSEPAESVFLRWYWSNGPDQSASDLIDWLEPGRENYLSVEVRGSAVPSVWSDTAGVISLSEPIAMDPQDGIREYCWAVDYQGSGSTRLFCSLNGTIQGSLTVQNPDCSARVLNAFFSKWHDGAGNTDAAIIEDRLMGETDRLKVYEQHGADEEPELRVYTDTPELLSVRYVTNGPGSKWYEHYTEWEIRVTGCGTGRLYIAYDGKPVKSIMIPAPKEPEALLSFAWFHPCDPETWYEVGYQNLVKMLVEGNEMPIISTDHPEVLQFDVASFSGVETVGRVRGYYITVRAVGPGEANLICSYHGEIAYVLPLKVKTKS